MQPPLQLFMMLFCLSHKAIFASGQSTSRPDSANATCASIGITDGCCSDTLNGCSPDGLCYCDIFCYSGNDCCSDIQDIGCFDPSSPILGPDTTILPVTVQFSSDPTVVTQETTDVVVQLVLQGAPVMLGSGSGSGSGGEVYNVDVSTLSGTAKTNEDFMPLTTTIQFLSGETVKNVTISIIDDDVREGTEAFFVQLTNPSPGLLIGSPFFLTITINDLFIEFNQTSYNLNEGESAFLTVMLSGDTSTTNNSTVSVTVELIAVNGIATAGEDYIPLSTMVSFVGNEEEWSTNISIIDDDIGESMESFTVELRNPSSGAVLMNNVATITINTDWSLEFSSNNLLINEGEEAMVTILRTGDALNSVTGVNVLTIDGTALDSTDYHRLFLTSITFASGETQRNITIQTIEDSIPEGSENFTVYLYELSETLLLHDTATVEISDDDIITIGFETTNYTISEGDAVDVTVVLSGQNVTVNASVMVSAVDGTAIAPHDFFSLSTNVTFAVGETRKDIRISTVDDSIAEGSRAFTVELSNPSPGVMLAGSDVVIIEILPDVITIEFDSMNYTVNEGENVTFRVVLIGDTPTSDIDIDIGSIDGTAVELLDYEIIYTSVTLTAGETEAVVSIQTFGDILMENTESFTVTLEGINSSSNATIRLGMRQAFVEIIDIDSMMVPEPVTNLLLDVFPSNGSVLVRWTDTQNIYDSELLYSVSINVSARGVLLSLSNFFVPGDSESFYFSASIFTVNGVVIDVSVQASNFVGDGMSVKATTAVPGVFAPMVQDLVVTVRDDVLAPSVTLEWNDRFLEVPPDRFVLNYSVNRLSASERLTEVSEFSVNLTQEELNSSLLYDYGYTLSNLLFYATYEFQLIAVYGTDESVPVTVLNTTSEGRPGTVENVMFILSFGEGDPGSMFNASTNTYEVVSIVSWSEPLEPNGVITMYQYSIMDFDTSEVISNGTVSGDTLGILTTIIVEAFTNYTVEVSASTGAGVGDAITANPETTPQAAPSAPRSIAVGFVTSTRAVVTWNTPAFPNGIIQYYTVSLSSGVMYNVTPFEFSLTLEHLDPNTPYTVEVYAVTVERGQSSDSVHFTTEQGIPTAVQDLTAAFIMDGFEVFDFSSGLYIITVYITWNQPFPLNGELSHYNYSGCLYSVERGTVEWTTGTVEWNSGIVEWWNCSLV